MTDKKPTPKRKPPKKKLKVEKRPLEDPPEDLSVSEEEAESAKGGLAKRPVPVPYTII